MQEAGLDPAESRRTSCGRSPTQPLTRRCLKPDGSVCWSSSGSSLPEMFKAVNYAFDPPDTATGPDTTLVGKTASTGQKQCLSLLRWVVLRPTRPGRHSGDDLGSVLVRFINGPQPAAVRACEQPNPVCPLQLLHAAHKPWRRAIQIEGIRKLTTLARHTTSRLRVTMSHDEKRDGSPRLEKQADRAARQWLDPPGGPGAARARGSVASQDAVGGGDDKCRQCGRPMS